MQTGTVLVARRGGFMGIARQRRAKLTIGDRQFAWYVSEGENGATWDPFVHVRSADGRFLILHALDQARSPFVVVMGEEFPGLPEAGRGWIRVRCPRFDDGPVVTPASVRRLVDWCLSEDKAIVRVDFRGRPIGGPPP